MSTRPVQRLSILVLLVALLTAALAGCAAPVVTPAAAPADAAASVDAAAPAEFTFTAWALNEDASKPTIQEFIQTYAAANNATIKEQAFPWAETLNQLVLQANGGAIEGASQLDIAWLNTLAATGKLMDLAPYVEGRGYTEAGLRSGQVDGVQYGLPWTTGSIGLVANQQILEAAGVTETPTTIAEFEAALEKIKAYDPEIIPYAGMTALNGLKDLIPWIWTFGGTVMDEEGNVTLGDEGSVAALEWYKSLLDRGLMAPEMDRATARQLFSQGKVAFYDDAVVVKGIVTKDTPIENLAALLIPVPRPVVNEGDDPQSLLWGHLVVVFDGANADAAAKWAQHLTSDPATTTTYFERMSLPPTNDAALQSDAVKNDAFISAWSEKVTATARLNPFWPYTESARMESILAEQAQAYLLGNETSAANAWAQAASQIAELME
ncbi:MAG: extracellular solute-binding protein [Caldilineaceae bacterium]|nr:extracellular solute-binding protein [Caldilineaceae bacterium]